MPQATTLTNPLNQRIKMALDAVKKLKAAQKEPIAIVGIGCRFPGGANSPDILWDKLTQGFDAIGGIPKDRWEPNEHFAATPQTPGKMYSRFGAFLEDVDKFDPNFFRITPREALSMDPQQRILLQVAWEAIENAGVDPTSLQGSRTGVYVGLTVVDYATLLKDGDTRQMDTYFATGNVPNMASGRLAYFFGFNGPSLTIDTACSSSLVATHQACQSLRMGDADMALAAGVNLILTPDNSIAISQAKMLAPDGRCKSFDASADGYSRAEGCGVVVLKRLSDALENGDRIYATIQGSAIGQDGASAGLTVPHGPSQERIIRQSHQNAQVQAGDVGYIEAHGTGTSLGDPIEIDALSKAYSEGHSSDKPLIISSLKSNLGHMESAAGIGGVIKAALSVYHGKIPQHLNLTTVNPAIQLDEIPALIPQQLTDWPSVYTHRIAGVSSFGSSGAIGHVIIGNHIETPVPTAAKPEAELFVLSALNSERFTELAQRYLDYLKSQPTVNLHDLCATAATGRAHFECRFAQVVENLQELRTALTNFIADKTAPVVKKSALQEIADQYLTGATIDWAKKYPAQSFKKLSLPTYAFEQKRYWVDGLRQHSSSADNQLGKKLPAVAGAKPQTTWQRTFSASDLADGCLSRDNTQILQTDAYLSLAESAACDAFPDHTLSVEIFTPHIALAIHKNRSHQLQTSLSKTTETSAEIKFYAQASGNEAWTLHATVKVQAKANQPNQSTAAAIDFGVMFFNGTEQTGRDESYRLIQEATRFADYHNFSSVWIPERHFTEFGGIYPNPSVMHAALAQSTEQIRLMAGSVVLPLHSPMRIAEEWAMVDNLSNGRTGISFASGWHPNDFTLAPQNYEERHTLLFENIKQLQALWRGESIAVVNGKGETVQQRIYPSPIQPELPLCITAAGNPRTFASAGSIGANLLTHLLDHDVEELAEKIALYRAEREKNGFDPNSGRVTVMLHTFLGDDPESVRKIVKPPFTKFLKGNIHLLKGLAASRGQEIDVDSLKGEALDEFVAFIFDRFCESRALLGTTESTQAMVQALANAGVNEIACLLDFGPSTDDMMAMLPKLHKLKSAFPSRTTPRTQSATTSFAAAAEQWKTRPIPNSAQSQENEPALSSDYFESIRFAPTWKSADLIETNEAFPGKTWLLCAEHSPMSETLSRTIEAKGATLLRVDFTNPEIPNVPIDSIIQVWEGSESPEADLETVALKMSALSRIILALQVHTSKPKIWTVTTGANAVHKAEAGDPIQSMVISMAKVIPIEHSALWGGLLDLDATSSAAEKAADILRYINNRSGEDRIAVRNQKTYIQRLTQLTIPPNDASSKQSISAGKNYLITGGSGGIGLSVAEWLLEEGATHLTLIGRRPASEIKLPSKLVQGAATVDYHQVDISQAKQVEQLAATLAKANKPSIAGIFHTAGIWEDCPIETLSTSQLIKVLAPKVTGTWNLYRTFGQDSLEFIQLFSAFSSIMPAHGQANYAAANGYLDAFAYYAKAQGVQTQSINWGPWAEVGFAKTAIGQRAHAQLESFGIHRFTPTQGKKLLSALLESPETQISLIDINWNTFFTADPQAALMPMLADRVSQTLKSSQNAVDSKTHTQLQAAASTDQKLAILISALQLIVGKVLHIEAKDLSTQQSLLHLGVDSLIAVQVKNGIENEIGQSLPLSKILSGPSLESLAIDLLTRLKVAEIAVQPKPSSDDQILEEIEI